MIERQPHPDSIHPSSEPGPRGRRRPGRRVAHVTLALVALAAFGLGGCDTDASTGPDGDDPVDTTPDAVPEAGVDLDVTRGFAFTLSASESTDPDGDPLTFTWTQILGPDVTGESGVLTGEQHTFAAPMDVTTLGFTLEADDGNGSSGAVDTIYVFVLENADAAIFVDGDGGNDSGDGTRSSPYATLTHAAEQANGSGSDIYVMSRTGGSAYAQSETLELGSEVSLYGGFDAMWSRDPSGNRTRIDGASTAVMFGSVDEDAWMSGFEVDAREADSAAEDVVGVTASGSAAFTLEDNVIASGAAGHASVARPGSSYGVRISGLESALVRRNMITAGPGGDGGDGDDGQAGAAAASSGGRGSNPTRGAGGSGGTSFNDGGRGGAGATGLGDNGQSGRDGDGPWGGSGGRGGVHGSSGARDGDGGSGGQGGNGGTSGTGTGSLTSDGWFQNAGGTSGGHAARGGGGGGGGGGASTSLGLNGGGGGGGGGGGASGRGGHGGGGGGASIALLVHEVDDALIEDNTLTSGPGGIGGDGGNGGHGGDGTFGGTGGPRKCGVFGCGASHSGEGAEGGGGGKGGEGGQGGGGGGGPSYGILVGSGISPTISGNTITTGDGGAGGSGGLGGRRGAAGHDGSTTGGSPGTVHTGPRSTTRASGQGGVSEPIHDVSTDDGFDPTLSGNTLNAGESGADGPSSAQAAAPVVDALPEESTAVPDEGTKEQGGRSGMGIEVLPTWDDDNPSPR